MIGVVLSSPLAVLVEHHRRRAGVHGVVPIEPAKRSERAIYAVDIIIHDHDRVAIHYPIFGHGLISRDRSENFAVRGLAQGSSLR